MEERLFDKILTAVKKPDGSIKKRIQERLDNLTKPPGSLGRLEEAALKYAVIRGAVNPVLRRKTILTFVGDHGIAEEGVSAYPKEVTRQMVFNFLRGGAAVNVLARHIRAGVRIVDVGVDYDFGKTEGLISKKVRRGTGNFLKTPAMTKKEAVMAIEAGIETAIAETECGVDIVGVGDMGIGNSSSAAGITAVITEKPVEEITGRGTGIDDAGLRHKIAVIKSAIALHKPKQDDPIDIMRKVGGLEIGAIAGAIIGCASRKIPIVLDGFIATAGALIAFLLNKNTVKYLFASHLSKEKGHIAALRYLGLKPLLDLHLRLGEGTGACLAINLIEAGVRILNEMATFDGAGVSRNDL